MEGVTLTEGAIAAITGSLEPGTGPAKPVVQVVDLRLLQTSQKSQVRFRLLISDGVHAQQAMLASQINDVAASGGLKKGSVVRLNEYVCSVVQTRRIIIILSLEVIIDECDTIGNPRGFDANSAAAMARPMGVVPSSGVQNQMQDDQPGPQANACSYGGGSNSVQTVGGHVPPKIEPGTNNYSGPSPGMSFSGQTFTNQPAYNQTDSTRNVNNQRPQYSGMAQGTYAPTSIYGRSNPPQYQKPPPLYQNSGPIAKNEAPARIVPVAALNPYQNRWTIKARVTAKSELRRYNNQRGEGKVFSFDLLDSDGGEIRAICFNAVADQFYEMLEPGKVYLISKGGLRPAQKNFNHLNNEYEIMLETTSTIQPCQEDNNIPKQQFNFRPVSDIESMDSNAMVDVIGVVSSITPSATILRKNGTETTKRGLVLKDMSTRNVEVTFWGNFCNAEGQQLQEMCDTGRCPVLAIKSCRVSDFSGKSLSTISSSQLFIDPDFPEAHKLREWYQTEGKNVASVSISREMQSVARSDARKCVSQIKDEGLGMSEKPDWVTLKAAISFIRSENFCYTACPLLVGDRPCMKKVNNNGDGGWHCDRCDQSFPECDYRYLLGFQIQDYSGMTWVTAFQESAEEIMGISAKELYLIKYEEQDDAKFGDILRGALFNEYLFKLKVKEETFNDEQRVKVNVVKAEKINASSESQYLLDAIDKLLAGEDSKPDIGRTSTFGLSNADNRYHEAKPPAAFNSPNSMGSSRVISDGVRSGSASYQPGFSAGDYRTTVGSNTFNREATYICSSCGTSGHSAQNCPRSTNMPAQTGGGYSNRTPYNSMGGGGASGAASGSCYKCQKPGHWARDCPGMNAIPSAYGGGKSYGF